MIKLEQTNEYAWIYEDMQKQFPKNELKSFERFEELLKSDNYNLYLAKMDEEAVGYVILAMDEKSMWLDYLAIFEKFHSRGFGGKIIKSFAKNFPYLKGCFLEVEKINAEKPNTIRRVNFYKNLSAIKLEREYFYPHQEGDLPMDLYFLQIEEAFVPDDLFIHGAIENIFALLHGELGHAKEVLFKNII